MIERRPFNELEATIAAGLNANHHFSFAGYGDTARTGWGSLQVWNDDEIAPYAGFPPTRRQTWNDGTVSGYPKWIEFDPANTGKIGMVSPVAPFLRTSSKRARASPRLMTPRLSALVSYTWRVVR